LHVLSTPPAFILSQDQTLHKKAVKSPKPNQKRQTTHKTSLLRVKLTKNYYIKKSTNPTKQKCQLSKVKVFYPASADNNYIQYAPLKYLTIYNATHNDK